MKLSQSEKARIAAQVAALRAAVDAQRAFWNAMNTVEALSAEKWWGPSDDAVRSLAGELSLESEEDLNAKIEQWVLETEPRFWRDPQEKRK